MGHGLVGAASPCIGHLSFARGEWKAASFRSALALSICLLTSGAVRWAEWRFLGLSCTAFMGGRLKICADWAIQCAVS